MTLSQKCAGPRNSTWFTRLLFFVKGWGLEMRLVHHHNKGYYNPPIKHCLCFTLMQTSIPHVNIYDARWLNSCDCNKLLCKVLHIYSRTTVFLYRTQNMMPNTVVHFARPVAHTTLTQSVGGMTVGAITGV